MGSGSKCWPIQKRKNDIVDYPGILLGEDVEPSVREKVQKITEEPPEPSIVEHSRSYDSANGQLPFSLMPVVRTTDKNVEVGNYFFLGDVIEEHYLEAMATLERTTIYISTIGMTSLGLPLSLGYSRYAYKGDYGYGDDIDGNPNTDDLRVVDVKFEQISDDIWLSASYIPSYALWASAFVDASRYQFREIGDGANWSPYQISTGIGTFVEWSPRGGSYYGDDWINPRGGRRVYVDYSIDGQKS